MHRSLSSAAVAALALLALATHAGAQSSGGDLMNATTTAEVKQRFLLDLDSLQAKFKALAEAIPAEKYTWRPAPGVRSVGEVLMHVASEYYVYTPMAYGLAPSPVVVRTEAGFKAFESQASRADVMKHLSEGFAFMRGAIAAADVGALTGTRKLFGGDRTIIETSFIMSADLHEHLGQLIAYARMQGIAPPWSK